MSCPRPQNDWMTRFYHSAYPTLRRRATAADGRRQNDGGRIMSTSISCGLSINPIALTRDLKAHPSGTVIVAHQVGWR